MNQPPYQPPYAPYGAPPAPPPVHRRGPPVFLLAGAAVFFLIIVSLAGLLAYHLFAGGLTRTLLTSKPIDADSLKVQTVDVANEVSVRFPPGAVSKKGTLTISSVTGAPVPKQGKIVHKTFDVSLGGQHQLDGLAEIEIPYPASAVPAGKRARQALMALSYDELTRSWDPVSYQFDKRRSSIVITTDHLSVFAYLSRKDVAMSPLAKVETAPYPYVVEFEDKGMVASILEAGGEKDALTKGYEAANDWLGIGSSAGTFAEEAMAVESLKVLNEAATRIGVGFALTQLALDLASGDDKAAAANAAKNAAYYAVGKVGTQALKIASVGVFAIDYSLNKFAQTALAGRYEIYDKAYHLYYAGEGKRGGVTWYKDFKAIVDKGMSPDQARAAIAREIDEHVREFWSDETRVADYQGRVMGTGWSGGGGLNEAVKKQISDNYKAELLNGYLQPVFTHLEKTVAEDQKKKLNLDIQALAKAYDTVTDIQIKVEPQSDGDKIAGLALEMPVNADPKQWSGQTDKKGEWSMKCTTLGYLMYGAPKKVKLVIPPAKPGDPPTVQEQPLLYTPGTTRVVFRLGRASGMFEGRVHGSATAQHIDGPVVMDGPVSIDIDDSGNVKLNVEFPLNFTAGKGVAALKGKVSGNLTGKMSGNSLDASGPITTTWSMGFKSGPMSGGKAGQGGGQLRATGTLVPGSPAVIKGEMKGASGPPVQFEARQTGNRPAH
jgi:hypothetical protein